jgi:hypothetical protein
VLLTSLAETFKIYTNLSERFSHLTDLNLVSFLKLAVIDEGDIEGMMNESDAGEGVMDDDNAGEGVMKKAMRSLFATLVYGPRHCSLYSHLDHILTTLHALIKLVSPEQKTVNHITLKLLLIKTAVAKDASRVSAPRNAHVTCSSDCAVTSPRNAFNPSHGNA